MARTRTRSPKTAASSAHNSRSARARSLPHLLPWLGGGALFAVVAVALLLLARPSASEAAPGQRVPIQGQQHIQPGQTHPPYNSDPPTSGWHYPQDLPAGLYEAPHPDELLVHNLEHGHIVISYDCSRLADCAAARGELKRIFDAYNGWKVTIVPRDNRDAAIALTAWGWIDTMDAFDEGRIRRFIDAWRNRGPEATMN